MKTAIVLCLLLFACASATHISEVENKVQSSNMHYLSDSVPKGDSITHYYYYYYGEGPRYWGWYCWEYSCDKTGLILKKREYWVGNDKAFDQFREKIKHP